MDSNPYLAPASQPGELNHRKTWQWLRYPAISLIVLSGVAVLLDLIIIANVFFRDAPTIMTQHGRDDGMLLVVANVGANLLLLMIHLFVSFGAVQMLRLRGYRNAVTASVVSLIPFCSPVVLLGIPFGLWALVLLCDADVQAAFDSRP